MLPDSFRQYVEHFDYHLRHWAEISFCEDVHSIMTVARLMRDGRRVEVENKRLREDIKTFKPVVPYDDNFEGLIEEGIHLAQSMNDIDAYLWVTQRADQVFSVSFELNLHGYQWEREAQQAIPASLHEGFGYLLSFFKSRAYPLTLVYAIDSDSPTTPDIYVYFRTRDLEPIDALCSDLGLKNWLVLFQVQFQYLTTHKQQCEGFFRINNSHSNNIALYWVVNNIEAVKEFQEHTQLLPGPYIQPHLSKLPEGKICFSSTRIHENSAYSKLYIRINQRSRKV